MLNRQITHAELLNLVVVSFSPTLQDWCINRVKGSKFLWVDGDCGMVTGTLYGTINGRAWQFVETPKEKLIRMIKSGATKGELLDALKQIDDHDLVNRLEEAND